MKKRMCTYPVYKLRHSDSETEQKQHKDRNFVLVNFEWDGGGEKS